MERPHGQLRAGLTDRLGGNNADSLAELSYLTRSKVKSVTLLTTSAVCLTGEGRANLEALEAKIFDLVGFVFANELADLEDNIARYRVRDLFTGNSAVDTR